MFTGIVTGLGTVRALTPLGAGADMKLVIATPAEGDWTGIAAVPLGASIACSGCCLTVIETGPDWFAVTASGETLSKTTLGSWQVGTRLNLERALRVGDELGGHIVSGHVDGVGRLESATPENASLRLVFSVPDALARYIAPKGSVAIDGVSLTINEVEGDKATGRRFGVNIIPHTAEVTTLGLRRPGDAVNIEIDTLARYVAGLQDWK
jgi:riboflavin synthase